MLKDLSVTDYASLGIIHMKKLTDISEIQYGYAFDSKYFTEDSSYPALVRIRDIKRGYSDTYFSGEYPKEYVLSAGDLLVGMDGEFNIAKWKTDGALLNQRVCKLVAKGDTNEEYLRFAMTKALKEIENRTSFVTVKHLSAKELNKLELNVPSSLSQANIANILSKIETIIELRKEELMNLENLVKARFAELFGDPVADSRGWGQVPLKQMLESIRYGTSTPPVFAEDGYCFIRATNIKNGRIVNNDMKHISQYEADRLEKCKLAGGEVLIVRSGVNAGDTCVITDEYIGQYAGYDMILVMKDEMNPIFLNELINTGYMNKVVKPLTRRAAQPHLNSEQVQSFPIIKVPKYLQDEFADFVKQTNKSKAAVQKSLDETQVLFDSLIQKYFG